MRPGEGGKSMLPQLVAEHRRAGTFWHRRGDIGWNRRHTNGTGPAASDAVLPLENLSADAGRLFRAG
jgi:hypothetical protein